MNSETALPPTPIPQAAISIPPGCHMRAPQPKNATLAILAIWKPTRTAWPNSNVTDNIISFEGPQSIIGRSVIVHAQADDFKTQPTGASGARVACGVIGIAK